MFYPFVIMWKTTRVIAEIAEGRTRQRKWKGRGTCQTRNQRVSCVTLTLEEREKVEKEWNLVNGMMLFRFVRIIFRTLQWKRYLLRLKRSSEKFDRIAMHNIFCTHDITLWILLSICISFTNIAVNNYFTINYSNN